MKRGFLSSYFEGIAVKRLSAVEADPDRSNQHEFNGVASLKILFGSEKKNINTQYIYLSEDEGSFESSEGTVTWYDSRERHPSRTEYRLYFSTNDATRKFKAGDLLLIGKKQDGSILLVVAEQATTSENQLLWLFGIEKVLSKKFEIKDIEHNDIKLEFASRFILEELGIQFEETNDALLGKMLDQFAKYIPNFPPTKMFSEFTRSTIPELTVHDDPDEVLVGWMEQEEMLFCTLERYLVSRKIHDGFGEDNHNVSRFLEFSKAVQNRRKSRAGYALENHLEELFVRHAVQYSRGKKTEGRQRPDFIFPSIEHYHTPTFPADLLTMLGVKTTCKDRWRQVLAEADKINRKHLFTIQPSITENQTNEMKKHSLQLVIPEPIQRTYSKHQQRWLLNLADFICFVREKQKQIEKH